MTYKIKHIGGDVLFTAPDASTVAEALQAAIAAMADLTGADLRRANLRGAVLTGADLSGANLTGASIHAPSGVTHVISRLAGRVTRSDGYEFFCFVTAGGGEVIRAGCRTLTIAEYRQHVVDAYPDKPKARETLRILDFLETQARADEAW